MRATSSRLRLSEVLPSIVGQRRIEDRVRYFLELVTNDHGVVIPHGIHINLRLTHQDITNEVSSIRVTATRVLSCLKKKGWLQSSAQRYGMLTHQAGIFMELSMATICIDSGQRRLLTDGRRKLLNHDKSTKRDEVTRHTCKPAVAFRPSIKIEPDNNVPNRRPAALAM